jgi:hypothetical protein
MKKAAVARKERSYQAEVKFSFTATIPVSSGRFVAIADCCPESPFFELAKEGTARSFELWEGRTVFHNYPDEVALKGLFNEQPARGLFLDILPVRFNNLDDLRDSLEKGVGIITTWIACSPVAITSFWRETEVGQKELVRQQFYPAGLGKESQCAPKPSATHR